MKIIRQGDVVIKLNTGNPEGKPRKDKTLALGEATGHHHTMTAGTVYGVMEGIQWVVLEEPTELTHQEHATITLPPGTHEVVIQREYSPEEIRRVID